MTLHEGLIEQARQLATQEHRRPSQVSLRRSVSASYYALFHLLVDAATRRIIRGDNRSALRACLARAFGHSNMKTVAQKFAENNVPPKLAPGLNGKPLQKRIIQIARTFVDLQQARHEADYDIARQFTRREALELAGRAGRAVLHWEKVQGTVQADTFLVGLLAFNNMRA